MSKMSANPKPQNRLPIKAPQKQQLFDINLDIKSCQLYPDNPRYQNREALRNNYIFAVCLVVMHVILCFFYGFLYDEPVRDRALYYAVTNHTHSNSQSDRYFISNFGPVFVVFATAVFVLVGFGLMISYAKRLVMSGLGFTLLVTVLTIEWYFLFNAFWAKCARAQNVGFSTPIYPIYLTNMEVFPVQSMDAASALIIEQQKFRIRATLTEALKCSLANSIIFSSILGRSGPLQAFIVAFIGTVGYQLNARLVVQRIGLDYGHTYRVFLFAGVAGLVTGYMLRKHHETLVEQTTKQHPNYMASRNSVFLSLFGSIIIWLMFPIFIIDPPYQHAIIQSASAHVHNSWISMLHSMAACTTTSIGISYLLHTKTKIRDLILAPLAGGIAVASASPYLVQPVWPILIGTAAGIIQCFANLLQKDQSMNSNIVNTFSFTVFGFHGLMGAVWASIFRAVIETRAGQFIFIFDKMMPASGQFLAGLSTIGLGLSFGLIIGIIIAVLAVHKRMDHFRDETYWSRNDGLNTIVQRERNLNICLKQQDPNSIQQQYQLALQTKSFNNLFSFITSQSKVTNQQKKHKKLNREMIERNRKNLLQEDDQKGEQHEWMQDHYRDDDIMRVHVKPSDWERSKQNKGKIRLEPIQIKLN